MARPLVKLTYTIPEAAAVLGISDDTLRAMVKRGEVPVMRVGRRVLVSKAELAAWVSANHRSSFRPIHSTEAVS